MIDDPYKMFVPSSVEDSLNKLDSVFEWAERYELRVLLSLFGLPGSQNGLESSGCTIYGAKWDDEVNRVLSLEALAALSDRYGSMANLLGIEAMDRPSDSLLGDANHHWLLKEYYHHAYEVIRSRSKKAIVIFHETNLSSLSTWRSIFSEPRFFNVALDIHLRISPEVSILANYTKIIASTGEWIGYISTESTFKPIIIGEWSLNANDGGSSHASRRSKQDFINAEQAAMSDAFGTFVWTWKVEEGLNEEDSLEKQLTSVNGLRVI